MSFIIQIITLILKEILNGFEYEYNNEKFKYYPDFILENGTYIEIKGYLDSKNKAKINQFKNKLIVIDKKTINTYLNYVINKYGKNFVELYKDYVKPEKIKKEKPKNVKPKNIKIKKRKNKCIINNIIKQQQLIKNKIDKENKIKNQIEEIKNSNINFSKFGWVNKVSKILKITPQKVNCWMKKNMLEFYNNNCFKRKRRVREVVITRGT